MAIKDLQQRLVKEEANSGEALLKKLKKELEAVYVDARGWRKHIGFNTEGTAGQWDVYDSYWEEAYKEILSESKDAVKASKSAKAKQVLGDLQSLVKDIAGTEGITAPIGAAVQKMISVVQPYIEERVKALKKGEGILTTMKKNAVASASSAVEGFVSATLSPLPFGAGDAIIGKAKGMLGGNKERRSTKAMDFISRVNENLEEEGGMVSSGSSAKKSGGVVSSSGGNGSGGETSFSFLENIDKNVQFIADNMEDAESRRERLRKQGVKVAGGKVAGAGSLGADGAGGDDGSWLSGLIAGGGGLSGLLGLKSLIGKNIFGKSGFFRNLKALLLKSARTVFGKTGGKLMTGLLKGIGFAGKLAGIAGVVIAPIIDGILGYFNAEEWGVSKLGGIIGGIMGGGEGGALNALFNGMKWAAIGATAGSLIFPGIGTIIGGIGGALIGAILGWIGGDKIAKAVDGIGKWFEEKWNGFLNIFGLGKKESKETKLKRVQEDKKEKTGRKT